MATDQELLFALRRGESQALDGLEQQTREVFLRYYYYNQPIREIALATGLSETAVKSRLLRGRKKRKEQLTEGGYLCED